MVKKYKNKKRWSLKLNSFLVKGPKRDERLLNLNSEYVRRIKICQEHSWKHEISWYENWQRNHFKEKVIPNKGYNRLEIWKSRYKSSN